MSFDAFCLLTPNAQLYWVFKHGTYLAHRGGEVGTNLYHCANEGRGFFVEISYDASQLQAMVVRSVSSSMLLEEYAQAIRLPE